MSSLYKMTAELNALIQAIDEDNHEDAPEDRTDEWMSQLKEQLEDQIEAKMDSCAAIVRTLSAQSKALKAEADFFKRRQKVVENHMERLKAYMTECLQTLVKPDSDGKHRVKSKFHCYLQNNPMSVDRDQCDLTVLSDKYLSYEPKISASAILSDIKATGVVPDGVTLFPVKQSVRIK